MHRRKRLPAWVTNQERYQTAIYSKFTGLCEAEASELGEDYVGEYYLLKQNILIEIFIELQCIRIISLVSPASKRLGDLELELSARPFGIGFWTIIQ